ncbi:MAG: Hsp20/alpha crystallin family protein [Silvanigrellaceae bacterium]
MKHDVDMNQRRNQSKLRNMLKRINPKNEKIADQVEIFWNHLYNDTRSIFKPDEAKHVHPRVDVLESKNLYNIRIDLPGADANSIDLKSEGRTLLVKAKRTCVDAADFTMSHCEHPADLYERGIHLAEDAVVEEKSATYSDGILSVRIPRKAA